MTNEELEMLAAGFDSGKGSVKSGRGSKYSINSDTKTLKELADLNAKKEESAKIIQRVIKGWLTRKKYEKKPLKSTPEETLEKTCAQNALIARPENINSLQQKSDIVSDKKSENNILNESGKVAQTTPILLKLPNELSDSFKETPVVQNKQAEEIKVHSDTKNNDIKPENMPLKIESPKKLPMVVKPPAEISQILAENECQTLLTKDDIDKWQKYFSCFRLIF